jgi:RNA polymerase sigma-70 factor, ECF subfamily
MTSAHPSKEIGRRRAQYPFADAGCLSIMSTTPREVGDATQASWCRFLDVYEPLRADLYRYCRHLTRSPWDAEDMAQDALARAYVTLGTLAQPPPNPRAWLFRVASNLWLNHTRRTREVPNGALPEDEASVGAASATHATREAAGTLIATLSPQERAAVVLKDVFALSLDEVAEALSTTPGAIKAALHRGRTKLVDPDRGAPAAVTPAVLDAFCDAFNARDLDRLTSLLLETATMELPGLAIERGARALGAGSLRSTIFGCPEGRYTPPVPPRSELRHHRGEPLLLWWIGDQVDAIVRVEVVGDKIARLRSYRHAPEVTTEVCRELGVPFTTHGHHPRSGSIQ